MTAVDRLVVIASKLISRISTAVGLGAGETWPGEIALKLRPDIARVLSQSLEKGVILVAGTNGKTTTSLMIKNILESEGALIVHNASGANLLNGIVSSCIRSADWLGRINADYGIFEVDENSLPIVLWYMTPKSIVILNLFRDQLDRYGETDVIQEKWIRACAKLPHTTTLVLNSDDPGVAWLGRVLKGKLLFFGVDDPAAYLAQKEHATDSLFCPRCGARLRYDGVYYSHVGIWVCEKCGLIRPKPTVTGWTSPLPGLYNRYNALAAGAAATSVGVPDRIIRKALAAFSPAFGRQEEIIWEGKTVKLLLSKNPAGFNASLRTAIEMGATEFLFILNDRIPDGRDVSWIWDVDFEMLPKSARIWVSGDRVYDMAIRIKYAAIGMPGYRIHPVLPDAFKAAKKDRKKTLYVLATYSGMLEARKILTGKKIL